MSPERPDGGPEKAPESSPDATNGPSMSIDELFADVAANIDGTPTDTSETEQAALKQLRDRYDEGRRATVLDTQSEIDSLRAGVSRALEDGRLDETEATALDDTLAATVRREQIEDTINELIRGKGEKAEAQEATSEATEAPLEAIDDLRDVPVAQLIALEDRYEGILLYAFTDYAREGPVSFEDFQAQYRKPTVGQELTIDFRGNQAAEMNIGLADILPPAVRRVTVFVGGHESMARTSQRRVGLKGQNTPPRGFYDGDYMDVYSGDRVVIGGIPPKEGADSMKDKERVDLEFEAKFRNADGRLDYATYATHERGGKADDGFLQRARPRRREKFRARGPRGLTAEERARVGIEDPRSFDLKDLFNQTPDMYVYAKEARAHFADKTGIDVHESLIFGAMQIESGFVVDIMNTRGSGAGGSLQFIPSTWNRFLKHNRGLVNSIIQDDPFWKDRHPQEWRFHPKLMIYAGFWLATDDLKGVHRKRKRIPLQRFQQSTFAKTGELTADDAWILYYTHHDGGGGAVKLMMYEYYRQERGMSAREAERKVKLERFQKFEHSFVDGRTVYDTTSFVPDQHLAKMKGLGRRNVQLTREYQSQMASMDLAAIEAQAPRTWGSSR